MLASLLSFLNSDGFSAFSIILGVLSNIATLVLTLYTFYLTTLSKNISLIGSSLNHSCFNGTKITFYCEEQNSSFNIGGRDFYYEAA